MVDTTNTSPTAKINTALLIELLIQDFGEMIARLATLEGQRLSLTRLDERLFAQTCDALMSRGYSVKVIADMFGLANASSLRRRMRRIESNADLRERTLRDQILAVLSKKNEVPRDELLDQFDGRDKRTIRSVIRDLVESGQVEQVEERSSYRIRSSVNPEESVEERQELADIVSVMICRLLHLAQQPHSRDR